MRYIPKVWGGNVNKDLKAISSPSPQKYFMPPHPPSTKSKNIYQKPKSGGETSHPHPIFIYYASLTLFSQDNVDKSIDVSDVHLTITINIKHPTVIIAQNGINQSIQVSNVHLTVTIGISNKELMSQFQR